MDNVLHRVTSCSLVKDYVLKVVFDDGAERTIDLEPILTGPIFGALRDQSLFKQVRLDLCSMTGLIMWTPLSSNVSVCLL